MAGRSVSVTVIGATHLAEQLRSLPLVLRPLFEAAAKFGQGDMARRAKPHEADKGTLAEAVEYELSGAGVALHARVGFVGIGHGSRSSMANLAKTVNYGRRAGRPPSIKRIRWWLKSHGFHASPRAVQRAIAARGTKGVLFLEGASEALLKKLPELMREAERQIEAKWGRRA